MSFDRACRAHSGFECVATWNYHRITSESSSVFRVACRRMTSRVFALLTPSFVSRSSQATSIARPRSPTVKLYWAEVQVVSFLRDAHLICSRWQTYLAKTSRKSQILVSFSRSLSCAQSRDQSAPVYQSGCSEASSRESIGLGDNELAAYDRKVSVLISSRPLQQSTSLDRGQEIGGGGGEREGKLASLLFDCLDEVMSLSQVCVCEKRKGEKAERQNEREKERERKRERERERERDRFRLSRRGYESFSGECVI